jgi:hypothetical protein
MLTWRARKHSRTLRYGLLESHLLPWRRNKMKSYVPFAVAAALMIGGCGKKDDAPSAASRPPVTKSEDSKKSVVPTPPMPAPVVPKGAEAPSPPPGQPGDTSSPDFKGGGIPDKNK